jgi:hypothetical protein
LPVASFQGKKTEPDWTLKHYTGLSAFYMKVGILEKKYTDGEDMHTHLNFLTMENQKLDKKAFNNEFLAQIMLMLIPQDSRTLHSPTYSGWTPPGLWLSPSTIFYHFFFSGNPPKC